MASLRWIADGIQAAQDAGGITLERYHQPGFTGGPAIRPATTGAYAIGWDIEPDPEPWEDEQP